MRGSNSNQVTVPLSTHSDRWLGLTVFGLVLFGVVMIYSASIIIAHLPPYNDDLYFVKKQLFSAAIGFSGLLVMTNIDYHFWKRWASWMLGITFVLLVSVFFFSVGEINGAHRWIDIAGQAFQPSELAKLTFIIYLSAWFVERKDDLKNIKGTFLPYLVILIAVSYLMLKEPDFGTLSIILASAIAIYYVAGISFKQVLIGLVVAMIGLGMVLTSPYRRSRVITFLNPSQETTAAASYQMKNISIAIGSGGLWGLGFGQSKQKRLFLPEPHTDSIFAIIVEELGSIRATLLVAAYIFLFYRGFLVAVRAKDMFGSLMATGITVWLTFETFINLGAMLRVVPLVGVPLPFVSYGGTSLIISLLAIGLLLNISKQAYSKVELRDFGKKGRSN